MSVDTEKTTGVTPAEFADQIQGEVRGDKITAHQAVIATGIIGAVLVDKPGRIRGLRGKILTTGTAAQTDLDILVVRAGDATGATVLNAAHVVDNAAADGIEFNVRDFVVAGDLAKVEPGDIVYVEVTAAATNGADLFAQVAIDDRFDPPVERPLLS